MSRNPHLAYVDKSAAGSFKETCKHFLQGKCDWGNNCRFQHTIGDKPDPRKAEKERALKREREGADLDDRSQGVPCGGGWFRYWDEATGAHFYSNPETGESKWEVVAVKRPKPEDQEPDAAPSSPRGDGPEPGTTIPQERKPICRHFLQNRCMFGLGCRFSHDMADAVHMAPDPRLMGQGLWSERPPDWSCPNCRMIVFGSKNACPKCHTPNPAGPGVPYHDGFDWDSYARTYGLPSGYHAYWNHYYGAQAGGGGTAPASFTAAADSTHSEPPPPYEERPPSQQEGQHHVTQESPSQLQAPPQEPQQAESKQTTHTQQPPQHMQPFQGEGEAKPLEAEPMGMPSPACQTESGALPRNPGAAKCTHFLKTGSCKFGVSCKFDHPPDQAGRPEPVKMPSWGRTGSHMAQVCAAAAAKRKALEREQEEIMAKAKEAGLAAAQKLLQVEGEANGESAAAAGGGGDGGGDGGELSREEVVRRTEGGASIRHDDALPEGWTKHWSRSREMPYYFHKETGKQQWRPPGI